MGASISPMVISILGVCGFRIAWLYSIFQMPEFHTPQCLYLSYAISWALTFLIQLAAVIFVYRKRIKAVERELVTGEAE